jgi:hypothetical protein
MFNVQCYEFLVIIVKFLGNMPKKKKKKKSEIKMKNYSRDTNIENFPLETFNIYIYIYIL